MAEDHHIAATTDIAMTEFVLATKAIGGLAALIALAISFYHCWRGDWLRAIWFLVASDMLLPS